METKAIPAEIVSTSAPFSGKAQVEEVYQEDVQAPYTIDKVKDYVPVPKEVEAQGSKFRYTFPPHAITVLRLE